MFWEALRDHLGIKDEGVHRQQEGVNKKQLFEKKGLHPIASKPILYLMGGWVGVGVTMIEIVFETFSKSSTSISSSWEVHL